jgi:AcrR family transcriptional regulator
MPVVAAQRPTRRQTPARGSYRHGDLRRALIDAGIELARDGGPDAVVLREATRRAGVVPNAAYRHFENRDALLAAVRAAAISALAKAMEAEITAGEAQARTPAEAARARLRAVGAGYLRFARAETGLFRTAFDSSPEDAVVAERAHVGPADKVGDSGLNPFQLLGSALDRLADAGLLAPERRPGAEFLAWSAVHGMAVLAIDGPLRQASDEEAQALGQRLLDMVERGLV